MNEEGSKQEQSPARQRTLRHMRTLLTKTVAGAAFGVAGCERVGPPMVCDPLPPPVDCSALADGDAASWLTGEATWIGATAEGGVRVQLTSVGTDVTFVGTLTADAGTLQDIVADPDGVAFTYVPVAGATTPHLSVTVQCENGTATAGFTLDLSSTPAAGAAVPLTFTP